MRLVPLLSGLSLAAALALIPPVSARADDSGVPKTVQGGGHKMKSGGKEMGAGFRGVGRGIKDVFTGKRSKEDFKQGKHIGTGVANAAKGVAGVGRGVGRGIKKGFQDNSSDR